MHSRVFHAGKRVIQKYAARFGGVVHYVMDYQIIKYSLLYILGNQLTISYLRNTPYAKIIGLGVLEVFLFCVLCILFMFFILRWKSLKSKDEGLKGANEQGKFFVLSRNALILVLLIFMRNFFWISSEREVQKSMDSFTNSSTTFEGYIKAESVEKHTRQELTVQLLEDIRVGEYVIKKNSTYILLKVPSFYKFQVGQICNIFGQLLPPENFDDFDYVRYLANQKIYFIVENPSISCDSISERREGSFLTNFLVDLKVKLIEDIDKVLNEPQSSLLAGILFGQKRLFSNEFDDATRIGGVSHIVAASGYNVTILSLLVSNIFSFLPKKYKLILSLIVIWLFAVLSGLSPSIVRACLMSSISIFALLFGRSNSINILLPFTAFIFVFLSPTALSNVGFLLSISAVFGLVYILPILAQTCKQMKIRNKFVENYILPTLSCTLSTLPVSVFVFKTITIWSVPVNALILPVLESTMLFGFFGILIQSFLPHLSLLFYSIVNTQLKYFEGIVLFIQKIPFGQYLLSDSVSIIIGISLLLFEVLLIFYFFPIKNEQYNYYLKSN